MFKKSQRQAQLIILATFLLGAISGGLSVYFVQKQQSNQASSVATVVNEIDKRVPLQADQRVQIEGFIKEMREEYRKIKDQTRPQYDAVRQQTRDKIRNVLNESQRSPYEEYVHELDAKREKNRQAEAANNK